MSDTNFSFNTNNFVEIEEKVKSLIESMKDLKTDLNDYKADLLDVWIGKGRNQFEKTYGALVQTLSDHIEGSWDLYEELLKVHEEYIQWDVNCAKQV